MSPSYPRSVQSQRGLNTVRSSVLFASPINPKALMATFSCFLSLKHSEKNWIVENLTTVGLVCCVLRMEEVDCHCTLEICTDHTGKNWWKMISWWPHSLLDINWKMYAFPNGAILILSDLGFGGSAASLFYSPPRLLSMQQNSLLNDECTYACEIYIHSSKIYKYSTTTIDFLPH